jgi:hypothetical protein
VPESHEDGGARPAESELAASLEAAEPGEPLLSSEPGLPEGVSDDVLSDAASREEGGESDDQ